MRTAKNQSVHDNYVEAIAARFASDGWEVAADHLVGWPKPPNLNGHIPDVYARRNGYEFVLEVETPDSEGNMEALIQRVAFQMWRDEAPSRREFRVEVTK